MKQKCVLIPVHQTPAVNTDAEAANGNASFDVLADFMEIDKGDELPSTLDADIENELTMYEETAAPSLHVDILNWWAQNKSRFPRLSTLARRIFSMPASSAAPERNFSTAGFVLNERRTRLSPSSVEGILVCHSNYDLIPSDE